MASGPQPLRMKEAIAVAKDAVADMTGMTADSVARSLKAEDGTWAVHIDVVESLARMGDNDLLATYEVRVDTTGELQHFQRLRRYHREDRET